MPERFYRASTLLLQVMFTGTLDSRVDIALRALSQVVQSFGLLPQAAGMTTATRLLSRSHLPFFYLKSYRSFKQNLTDDRIQFIIDHIDHALLLPLFRHAKSGRL